MRRRAFWKRLRRKPDSVFGVTVLQRLRLRLRLKDDRIGCRIEAASRIDQVNEVAAGFRTVTQVDDLLLIPDYVECIFCDCAENGSDIRTANKFKVTTVLSTVLGVPLECSRMLFGATDAPVINRLHSFSSLTR